MSGTSGRAPAARTNLSAVIRSPLTSSTLWSTKRARALEHGDVVAVLDPVALAAGGDGVDAAEHPVDDGRPVDRVEGGASTP